MILNEKRVKTTRKKKQKKNKNRAKSVIIISVLKVWNWVQGKWLIFQVPHLCPGPAVRETLVI